MKNYMYVYVQGYGDDIPDGEAMALMELTPSFVSQVYAISLAFSAAKKFVPMLDHIVVADLMPKVITDVETADENNDDCNADCDRWVDRMFHGLYRNHTTRYARAATMPKFFVPTWKTNYQRLVCDGATFRWEWGCADSACSDNYWRSESFTLRDIDAAVYALDHDVGTHIEIVNGIATSISVYAMS
jgi:hypothetical protein